MNHNKLSLGVIPKLYFFSIPFVSSHLFFFGNISNHPIEDQTPSPPLAKVSLYPPLRTIFLQYFSFNLKVKEK